MAKLIRRILTVNAAWEPTINVINVDTAQSSTEFRPGLLAESVQHLKREGEGTLYTVFVERWTGMGG